MGKLSSLIRAVAGKKRFTSAIILAAGSGRRFSDDRAKQFELVGGESVLVRGARAFEECELISEIKRLVEKAPTHIIGYKGAHSLPLAPEDINCFSISNGKVYALTDNDEFFVKERIYELEGMLGEGFVKINQSCIANTKKILRFSASIGGALQITFKNGHRDYVSRRQLKTVKKRIGL